MDRLVPHFELKKICTNALMSAGISGQSAEIVADNLVDANLRGIDSHGVMRLPFYIRGLQEGLINPNPQIKVRRSGTAVIQVDGDNGLGALVGHRAMCEAIELSRTTGIAAAGVRGSNHFGTLSYYLLLGAKKGLIGIGVTNAESLQVPFQGKEEFFGTNPIGFAFPTRHSPPISVDFATSAITFGQVYRLKERAELVPEGCVLDKTGAPTREAIHAAKILPAAGHKGYGLALAVDVLSGILNGAPFGPHIPRVFTQSAKQPMDLSHFFLVLDPHFFFGGETFLDQVELMIKELHAVSPAGGVDGVLVPGEPEARTFNKRVSEGIPLPPKVLEDLEKLLPDS